MRIFLTLALMLFVPLVQALPEDFNEYFKNRQRAAQQHVLANLPATGNSIHAQLIRFETNTGPLDAQAFITTIEKLRARRDTSDFNLNSLVRMLYQYGDSPLWRTSDYGPDLKADIVALVLGFKYWIDEPGIDDMVYWSENHQILFHACAFLMGQMFPDAVFTNSGMTGMELKNKHRPMLLRWLELRARAGFSEWHSNNYYEEDIGPLLNLVDFADDPLVARNAEGVAQLLLLDMALYSHGGVFGGSHGRTFERNNVTPERAATRGVNHLVFAQGSFTGTSGVSFSPLSVTTRFRPDPTIVLIGRKDWHSAQGIPAVWNDYSRMGFDPGNAHEFGVSLDPDNYDDVVIWWGNGGYILPEVVGGTFETGKAYDIFEGSEFFRPFGGLVLFWDMGALDPVLKNPLYLNAAQAISLQTTHTVSHHKPGAMLSVAQDKSKGNLSFQNHAWSAVLNGNIKVFSNHPLLNNGTNSNLDYYTGAASMPRIAQYEDVALILNKPNALLTALASDAARTTHAFWPVERFDEVHKAGRWHFGRKDDGYIALYSHNRGNITKEGRFANREIIAPGIINLWICEIGWQGEDGSFADFIERVSQQKVSFQKYYDQRVLYSSDQGELRFSWSGDFSVNGQKVPLTDNPRYGNPFVQTQWKDSRFHLQAGELSSEIHFDFGEGR
ncbi:MAG: hypothetical protein R3208_16370 [Ketobacteraceae bacterium]|nr:hypothetical protein [Ketobacteraceae bacterium]